MTDVSSPPAHAPQTPVLILVFLIVVIMGAGLYGLWEQQNIALSAIVRVDARLEKLEAAQNSQGISDKLEKLDARLMDLSKAADMTANQSNDVKTLAAKLDQILADQSKLHDEIAQLRGSNHDARPAVEPSATEEEKEQLKQDLSALAPTLLAPTAPANNIWDAAMQDWQRWVTARPLPSASADTTTLPGQISRALYEIDRGQIQIALDVLPKDNPKLTAFRARAENIITAQSPSAAPSGSAITTPSSNATGAQTP